MIDPVARGRGTMIMSCNDADFDLPRRLLLGTKETKTKIQRDRAAKQQSPRLHSQILPLKRGTEGRQPSVV